MAQKKLLIVVPTLHLGGAERVAIALLRNLNRSCFDISLVLLKKDGKLLREVPLDIPIFDLGRKSIMHMPLAVLRFLSLLGKLRPDVVLSITFPANIVALLCRLINKEHVPLVISEHIAPLSFYPRERLGSVKLWLIRRLYRYADRIVVPSDGIANELLRQHCIPSSKVRRIYNPIDLSWIKSKAQEEIRGFEKDNSVVAFISVGRLHAQKDYPSLIRAFANVRKKVNSCLVVIGEGPERRALVDLTRQLGVTEAVIFVGETSNPYAWMRRSDVFVLSSRYEGFGIVLVEAMTLGLPVIATTCQYGPEEILNFGDVGILVPPGDVDALASAMIELAGNEKLRLELGNKAKERARSFDISVIIPKYEDLLFSVAK